MRLTPPITIPTPLKLYQATEKALGGWLHLSSSPTMKADFYPRLTLIIITAATLVLTFLYFYKRYVNHIPGPSRGDALYKLALEKMHLGK